MTIHKRFQKDFNEGSIEVQVNFDIENGVVKVSNIHIKGTFDHGLPAVPTIEHQNNNIFLVAHYINEEGNRISNPIIGNKYADEILKDILKLRQDIK